VAEQPNQPDLDDLIQEIRRLRVSDLLLSTFSTIAQLGYAKLEVDSRDLDQARLAVEAMKAIVGVLEGHVPPETSRDFSQVVANLQLAYASAATAAPDEPSDSPP
jgi:hypothetical protein